MSQDPSAERRKLTFEQAEGMVPLPTQLALGHINQEVRSALWLVVHSSLCEARSRHPYIDDITEPWHTVLLRKHVVRDHEMVDDWKADLLWHSKKLRAVFEHGQYWEVLGLVE